MRNEREEKRVLERMTALPVSPRVKQQRCWCHDRAEVARALRAGRRARATTLNVSSDFPGASRKKKCLLYLQRMKSVSVKSRGSKRSLGCAFKSGSSVPIKCCELDAVIHRVHERSSLIKNCPEAATPGDKVFPCKSVETRNAQEAYFDAHRLLLLVVVTGRK